MYQALYRKYRPTSFDDVCGQEHITSVLKTQLQKGRVSHAYIFCGSRGTGKTTCAKILAKAVNCENLRDGEPCNECDACRAINEERVLDVVEMDAASNNGVDHIRRLCDEAQFLPSEVKKRVYIIDEVHMLSDSAFNALLKTIEEPPAHVLFILATTEMNDIPATIMSRCQRFDFKRLQAQTVAARLLYVSEKEGIPLNRDAASVLARLSDGAMRDALSLLEACQGFQGEITAEVIHELLGLGSRSSVLELCRAIAEQNAPRCLDLVQSIYERTSDLKELIAELISLFRDLLVIKSVPEYQNYVDCYENERAVLTETASHLTVETLLYLSKTLEEFYVSYDRIATGKKASVEMLMLRLCHDELSDSSTALLSRISKLEKCLENGASLPPAPKEKLASKKDPEADHVSFESPSAAETANADGISKVTPSTASKAEVGKKWEGSVRLKNQLQQDMFFKPFLSQVEFEKSGSVLNVVTGSFVKGIFLSSKLEGTILKAAAELDPEITSVQFVDKEDQSNQNTPTEFAGL